MDYNEFTYLYPPRPKTSIPPSDQSFDKFKKLRWIAELKLNGQRCLIYISPDFDIEFWNRHGEKHNNWKCPNWLMDELKNSINHDGKWLVIDCELLHNKDKSIKNTIYIWDILVAENKFLFNSSYINRRKLLNKYFGNPNKIHNGIGHLSDNLWLSSWIEPEHFKVMWELTGFSYIEGYVFKNPNAKLKLCLNQNNNHKWMVRCRKSNKCYRF